MARLAGQSRKTSVRAGAVNRAYSGSKCTTGTGNRQLRQAPLFVVKPMGGLFGYILTVSAIRQSVYSDVKLACQDGLLRSSNGVTRAAHFSGYRSARVSIRVLLDVV